MATAANNPHQGHRERMRQRFLASGFNGFSQHQILEMLLFYTCPRIDTNEIAHELVNRFGSISGVFDASVEDIVSVKGVNMNSAVLFKMIAQCQEIYYTYHMESEAYDNCDKLKKLFLSAYTGVTHEEFRIACLDNNLRLMGGRTRCISSGNPSCSPVHIRAIADMISSFKCDLIVIAHNHPNASPEPSTEDIFTTRRICEFMRSLGGRVLDHIIVGANEAVSMRETPHMNIFD